MINPAAIKTVVKLEYPHFGVNKQREIIRLLYEIAKREKLTVAAVINDLRDCKNFNQLKNRLLSRRFPGLSAAERRRSQDFPELEIHSVNRLDAARPDSFYPRNIVVEDRVAGSSTSERLRRAFPQALFKTIPSYKEYIRGMNYSITDYNRRSETFFVTEENYHFLSPCPCSPQAVGCGYLIANIGFGCPFECTYCYLQGYANSPGILFPANLDDYFAELAKIKTPVRLGTGQFTDSLVFDDVTGFSDAIRDFLRGRPQLTFEFKTKSDNVGLLLQGEAENNIVISWSVNTPAMISQNEFLSAGLEKRLAAAVRCVRAGYRVGFHFDPIIHYPGWEEGYADLIRILFAKIPAERIAWISLGTLRMSMPVKSAIENRFPENRILDGELFPGFDGKLRYPQKLRMEIYKKIYNFIRGQAPKVFVYLCMEEKAVHQQLRIRLG